MRKLIFFTLFSVCSIVTNAQTPSGYKQPKDFQLNKNPKALGIAQQAVDKAKKSTKPPINIALFGVDKREDDDRANSDVIIILSIDQQEGKVKMASIMRDTYVKIDGLGMDKINAAYAMGGPQLAIKTINQNFELDIQDYMNVDFYNAAKIVDALGGVDVNVKDSELPYLNNYLDEIAIHEKRKAVHVKNVGFQKLNGRQAVAYTRIRAVGNGDYERTERQRSVLVALFNKLKDSGQEMIPVFATKIIPNLETSMSNLTLLSFAGAILGSKNKTIAQARFPLDKQSTGKRINGIWYLTTDLETTTNSIHNFIFQ
jgi:LCP family protein required for cell wall assembly